MSVKHPIISVTGSSGAGTTSVRQTFENIFRREHINAAFVEGDGFHRYTRSEMEMAITAAKKEGNDHLSHFSPEANLLEELEDVFTSYGEYGSGRSRHYIHDDDEATRYSTAIGTFTPWEDLPRGTDLMFYEGLHGAVVTETVNVARHADLKIGVVPVINLEWIQKLLRDKSTRGYSQEAAIDAIEIVTIECGLDCVGDLDGTGTADVFDFTLFANEFGGPVPTCSGSDFDADGLVTVFDFTILAGDFGCFE